MRHPRSSRARSCPGPLILASALAVLGAGLVGCDTPLHREIAYARSEAAPISPVPLLPPEPGFGIAATAGGQLAESRTHHGSTALDDSIRLPFAYRIDGSGFGGSILAAGAKLPVAWGIEIGSSGYEMVFGLTGHGRTASWLLHGGIGLRGRADSFLVRVQSEYKPWDEDELDTAWSMENYPSGGRDDGHFTQHLGFSVIGRGGRRMDPFGSVRLQFEKIAPATLFTRDVEPEPLLVIHGQALAGGRIHLASWLGILAGGGATYHGAALGGWSWSGFAALQAQLARPRRQADRPIDAPPP